MRAIRCVSLVLPLLIMLLSACVARESKQPLRTPEFFITALEDLAVRRLRPLSPNEVFAKNSLMELEEMRGWRGRADRAWLHMRTFVDEFCDEKDYRRLTDREVWTTLTCMFMGPEEHLLIMILHDQVEAFINGMAKKWILATGTQYVIKDQERRKAVREVG